MLPLAAVRKLFPATAEHQQVEEEVDLLLRGILDSRYIRTKREFPRPLRYAQRNFFSILFLAVYRALGIPREHRLFYGTINHCLRGIVTGTDNLLDDEYKELLPLDFPERATRFKSAMHLLLFDRILDAAVERAAREGLVPRGKTRPLLQAVFQALVPIGAEEAREEAGIHKIISPAAVLSSVHMYKGGKLLGLSFVAPRFLDEERAAPLALADQGIYAIGVALQMIDDLTDFYEDIRNRNHNYLISVIDCEGTPEEKTRLRTVLAASGKEGPPIEDGFADSLGQVMEQAIGRALDGFDLLARAGFPLERPAALSLIRALFRLRGVGHLLAFLPQEACFTPLPRDQHV
jgi:hypothetical protein